MAPASTDAWRVKGLVTAGNKVRREVWVAAWPSSTKVSREIIWLSRIPAPSKPAASMDRIRRIRSGMGEVPGTRMETRTGSLIAGTPLLPERRHALCEVSTRAHAIPQLLLRRLAPPRVVRDDGADLPLHGLHRGWAVGRDLLGRLERPGHEPLGGHDAVDQTQPGRLGGVDQPPGQEQVHGVHVPDLLRELQRGTAKRIDRPLHLGQAEAGVRGGGPDVGGEQELEAAPHAVTVHRGDDRLRERMVLEERLGDVARRLLPCAQVTADVCAHTEGARPGARDHDAAAGALLELSPHAAEIRQHGPRHGVQPRLVVDGHHDDVGAVLLDADLHWSASREQYDDLPRGLAIGEELDCLYRALERQSVCHARPELALAVPDEECLHRAAQLLGRLVAVVTQRAA